MRGGRRSVAHQPIWQHAASAADHASVTIIMDGHKKSFEMQRDDANIVDAAAAKACADTIGYPVMIKAAAGGGGRGIRVVEDQEAFERYLPQAAAEAEVLPVDAQMMALLPSPAACVTATVMPRSLNEPVGLDPSNLA